MRFDRLHGGVRGVRSHNLKGGNVTKFAPHNAVRLIASGKLTFDERVVLHRVGVSVSSGTSPNFYEVQLEPFLRDFFPALGQDRYVTKKTAMVLLFPDN